MVYAHITGWGMAVPEKIMTNEEICKLVDTNDEWIRSRTGIVERRIAGEGESSQHWRQMLLCEPLKLQI